MNSVCLKAYAKINLHLEITGKRNDGFHEVRTLMQTIDIHDQVTVSVDENQPPGAISLTCDDPEIPLGKNNIIVKLLESLKKCGYSIPCGLSIHLQKTIPQGAGMGGGSSDGVAALLGLGHLVEAPPSLSQCLLACAMTGSDLSFFLFGGLALCTGRGEEVIPLGDIPSFPGIMVLPKGTRIATPSAYQALSPLLTDHHTDFKLTLGLAEGNTPQKAFSTWTNAFQDILSSSNLAITNALAALESAGAPMVRMTGSGAGVYGLFEHSSTRDQAMVTIEENSNDFDFIGSFSNIHRQQYQSEVASWLWT